VRADNAPLITPALFCKVRRSRIRSGESPGIGNLCPFPATMRDMCIMCAIFNPNYCTHNPFAKNDIKNAVGYCDTITMLILSDRYIPNGKLM
jgi:hypothetical protein